MRLSHRWIASVPIEALIRTAPQQDPADLAEAASVAVILECAAVAEASGDGSQKPGPHSDLMTAAGSHVILPQKTWLAGKDTKYRRRDGTHPIWPSLLAMLRKTNSRTASNSTLEVSP